MSEMQAPTTPRTDRAQEKAADLKEANGPQIDRRGLFRVFAGAAATAAMSTLTTTTKTNAQEQVLPAPSQTTRLVDPKVTSTDTLFQGYTRTPIDRISAGTFRTTAPGGVVLYVADVLNQIEREKLPKDSMMKITVPGKKEDTVFLINPKNVPERDKVDGEACREAMRNDKGLSDFVKALSATNSQLGVGVQVTKEVGPDGKATSATFQFIRNDTGKPAGISVEVAPAEVKK